VSRYQKSTINLDFTEARDIEWQWHQLNHMQVCTSLQTDDHVSTPSLSFLQAGCPSCRPTNSVKALKAITPQINCTTIYMCINQCFFLFPNVWLVVVLCFVFLLADCGSVSASVCSFVCVFAALCLISKYKKYRLTVVEQWIMHCQCL